MTGKPRSIRLTDAQHRFLDESNFEWTSETRAFIDTQRVEHAVGVCAGCGYIVYTGGFTVVSGGSPLGETAGIELSEELDICTKCESDLLEALRVEDGEAHLPYYSEFGSPKYAAERQAVADARPASEWSNLILERDELTEQQKVHLVSQWYEAVDDDLLDGDVLESLDRLFGSTV